VDLTLPPTVEDAIALAARAHRGQRYASPEAEPFIFHPLLVMLTLLNPIDQMAAVLHDTVEDTDLQLHHLSEASYPTELLAAIDCLTHRTDEPYEDYITRVATNDVARRVKIADLRDNLANNRRSPDAQGNADRIRRYQRALAQLATPP
jgi:hypothetical protein